MRPWERGRASILVLLLATSLLPAAAEPGRGGSESDGGRLPSLAIGKSYSTWRLAQAPVVVRNPSDDTLCVHVQLVVPARHEVRPGVLPVPDRDWVQLVSTDLTLPPHSVQRTDVRLSLPYDPDLAGHTYEVDLWTGPTTSDGRPSISNSQRHRILFTVEKDYRDDTEVEFTARRQRGVRS